MPFTRNLYAFTEVGLVPALFSVETAWMFIYFQGILGPTAGEGTYTGYQATSRSWKFGG
jgi:hypothetical protein